MNTRTSAIQRFSKAVGVLAVAGGLSILGAAPSNASGTAFNPYTGESITAGTATINKGAETTVAITDVQVSSTSPTDRVPVQLSVDSGSLSLGTSTGLSFYPAGTTSGSTISFSGMRSAVNSALATLTYTKGGSDTVNLTAKLWDPSKDFTCSTGHLYRVVDATLSYALAKTQATTQFGGNGYLVTPTTDAENTCVYTNVMSKASSGTANLTWIGAVATYASPTVTFSWDGGPENGTAFWSKTANATGTSGTAIGGSFAKWDIETISSTLVYQPNAAVSGSTVTEPCVVYYKQTNNDSTWHDVTCTGPNKYVIEGDNPQLPTTSVVLNFNATSPSSGSQAAPLEAATALATSGANVTGATVGAIVLLAAGSGMLTLRKRKQLRSAARS